ncbi:MAG: hypothetical protein ABSA71_05770 [Desulfomonilia bacterium]|jgi:hypothetical protein
MQSNIHFRFKGFDSDNSDINLTDLGSSLIGFDKVIRKLTKTVNLKGEIFIKASSYRDGSIIVDAIVEIINEYNQLPFDKLSDLLDFLKIANDIAWQQANHFFADISNNYKTLNDYFTSHPLDLGLLIFAITELIDYAKDHKKTSDLGKSKLPVRIAKKLHLLIRKHGFKSVVKPMVEDKISSIEISPDREFKKSAIIDQTNFEKYLAEDDMILPELENGNIYPLIGVITSLKSTRGDSLTFKYVPTKKIYYLDLLPPDGISTKKYRDYYQDEVMIKAEVIRSSLYKKPKLKIVDIGYKDLTLDFNNELYEK